MNSLKLVDSVSEKIYTNVKILLKNLYKKAFELNSSNKQFDATIDSPHLFILLDMSHCKEKLD